MKVNFLINRSTDLNFSLRQWLLICCCFSCVLVCIRMLITGNNTYLFLAWNLFLAVIPFLISEWLFRNIQIIAHRWKLFMVLLGWLLFIPNSFYIVTDLYHLEQFDSAPKWFDLLLLFSFAWNGILLGIISIRKIELIIRIVIRRRFSFLFVFVVMWLNAFGIYVGRYLRFNSWDVVAQPFSLFGEMLYVIMHPLRNRMEWGMITCWAVFMALLYISIKKLGESFVLSRK